MNTTEIDPGYLPADFATPGMQMLRDGQYREARRYYQTLTDARPNDAHGWFGLGSALLNEGKVRDAARAMLRGMTLAPEFPLGALLAETPALQPSVLFSITEIFVADKSEPARECALAALSRCLAHPCPPHNVFVRADSLRRRLCAAQVPQQDQTVQPVVELSGSRQKFDHGFRRLSIELTLSAPRKLGAPVRTSDTGQRPSSPNVLVEALCCANRYS